MAHQCSKCGSGDTKYKEGISKKGKPYKGYRCNECEAFDFINEPKPQQKFVPNNVNDIINVKLDKIIKLLEPKDNPRVIETHAGEPINF